MDASTRNGYRFVLDKINTYPGQVLQTSRKLEDAGCKDAILANGHLTDGKLGHLMLSHIGDVTIMSLIDKSACEDRARFYFSTLSA